jgi:hypothetical protein
MTSQVQELTTQPMAAAAICQDGRIPVVEQQGSEDPALTWMLPGGAGAPAAGLRDAGCRRRPSARVFGIRSRALEGAIPKCALRGVSRSARSSTLW